MAKRLDGTCRTCKHLHCPTNTRGNRYFPPDAAYECRVPVPPPVLPISMTMNRNYHWPPARTWIFFDLWNLQCPTWEKWEKVDDSHTE